MPPADPTDAILSALGQSNLLDPMRLAELTGWVAQFRPDPQTLAKELTRRGWLTPFQVKELYKGRAKDLVIGPYQLLDLLGEGGMGRVFKARHTRLGREEALKVIRKEKLSNPIAVARFQHEIRAAAQLSHPNVVVAFDSDSANGMHFFSMEYVDGIDLTKLVRERGAMPIAQACDAIRQAALGLQHAYEKGLVHRDIKPSNLIITQRGVVKLLDLGLAMLNEAQLAGGEKANRVTQDGFVLGTPDFLAPEQAQNPMGVDIRADIYGLGSTLFYLLTARVPYEGANPTEKLLKHISEPPPSLLALRPDAPPQLDAFIKWLMAKKPAERPQTPAQVAMAILPFCPPQSGMFANPGSTPHSALPMQFPATPFPQAGFPAPPLEAYPPPAQPIMAPPQAPTMMPAQPMYMPTAVPVQPEFGNDAASAFADFETNDDADDDDDVPAPRGKEKSKPKSKRKPQAAADGTKAVRVREPKQRSNLMLILIGGFVALTLFCGIGGYVFYDYVNRGLKDSRPLEDGFTAKAGIIMKKVDAGNFMMGSPEGEEERQENEGKVHQVTLTQPFFMSTTEITRQQFLQVTGSAPSMLKKIQVKDAFRQIMPAEGVNYDEAVAFCKELNRKEAAEKYYRPGWEYRLPTEAEWEYVARAGEETPFAHFDKGGTGDRITMQFHAIFNVKIDDPYRELPPDYDVKTLMPYPAFTSLSQATTLKADDKYRLPNKWGFYDMHGNVAEWCKDYYVEEFPAEAVTDPTGPAQGSYRVIRGGSWQEPASKCRSAWREAKPPATKADDIGFRVVYAKIPEKK